VLFDIIGKTKFLKARLIIFFNIYLIPEATYLKYREPLTPCLGCREKGKIPFSPPLTVW
jgi:hypothetical protein